MVLNREKEVGKETMGEMFGRDCCAAASLKKADGGACACLCRPLIGR
jgi:hypothetical protein